MERSGHEVDQTPCVTDNLTRIALEALIDNLFAESDRGLFALWNEEIAEVRSEEA